MLPNFKYAVLLEMIGALQHGPLLCDTPLKESFRDGRAAFVFVDHDEPSTTCAILTVCPGISHARWSGHEPLIGSARWESSVIRLARSSCAFLTALPMLRRSAKLGVLIGRFGFPYRALNQRQVFGHEGLTTPRRAVGAAVRLAAADHAHP